MKFYPGNLIVLSLLFCPTVLASVIHVPVDYAALPDAIAAAQDLDTVLISDGTYPIASSTGCNFNGKDLTVMSENGPDACVLISAASPAGQAFVLDSGEGSNCRIEGLCFRQFGSSTVNGSALALEYSSPSVTNCRFEDCSANKGTVWCSMGLPVFISCEFLQNTGTFGAAIWADLSAVNIDSCRFHDNASYGTGGAVSLSNGFQYSITNCRFESNRAQIGSAIYLDYSGIDIINCLFVNNICSNGATISAYTNSSPKLLNCTLADNSCATSAGGLYVFQYGNPTVLNCIFWNTSPIEIDVQECPDLTVDFSCIRGGYPGTSNINSDPSFAMGYHGDYYLAQNTSGQPYDSPCIDTGGDVASLTCYDSPAGTICLDSLTTCTNHTPDELTVNMGYHYPLNPPITPSPSPSPTSTFSPAPTPPSPSSTPFYTSTPVPTNTPTPSPTGTSPYPALGVALELKPEHVHPGDQFQLTAVLCNDGPDLGQLPFALLMDVYSSYFWYPQWSPDFDVFYTNFKAGSTPMTIFDFSWPVTGTQGSGVLFYGAMLNRSLSGIIGEYAVVSFSWE